MVFVPFAYIRWFYVKVTALTLDDTGLRMAQPFALWFVRWSEIHFVQTTSAWDVTHRGGIAAGVRIVLRDGSVRHIPDILEVTKTLLVQMIAARREPKQGFASE